MAGQRPLHARGRARPLPRPAGARTPARRHPPGRPRQAPAGGGLGRVGAAPRAGALTGQALQGRAVLRGPGAERPPLPDHRGTAPQRLRAGQRRPAARGLLAAARRAGKPGRAALAADLAAAARRAAVPALRARHPVRGGRRAGAMSTVASAGAAATPAPDFELPAALLAAEPPEARGLSRGGVRLMVSRGRAWPVPAEFRELPGHLRPGDLVVVNTSSTLPAVLPARRPDGRAAVVRLATPLAMDGPWVVELPVAPDPDDHPWPSEAWVLPGQGHLHLLGPYRGSWRLWLVDVRVPPPLPTYLAEHGRPLRPEGVATDWPLEVYQSCFAREPGSTAMASAGRAFTPELLTALVSSGIVVAPLLLHTCGLTGEDGGPLPERYHVPPVTARLVNHTRASGGRVIAVGTTVVRALESVAAVNGVVRPARGWTEQVVTPERGVRVVDGLLTGWHEPGGSGAWLRLGDLRRPAPHPPGVAPSRAPVAAPRRREDVPCANVSWGRPGWSCRGRLRRLGDRRPVGVGMGAPGRRRVHRRTAPGARRRGQLDRHGARLRARPLRAHRRARPAGAPRRASHPRGHQVRPLGRPPARRLRPAAELDPAGGRPETAAARGRGDRPLPDPLARPANRYAGRGVVDGHGRAGHRGQGPPPRGLEFHRRAAGALRADPPRRQPPAAAEPDRPLRAGRAAALVRGARHRGALLQPDAVRAAHRVVQPPARRQPAERRLALARPGVPGAEAVGQPGARRAAPSGGGAPRDDRGRGRGQLGARAGGRDRGDRRRAPPRPGRRLDRRR